MRDGAGKRLCHQVETITDISDFVLADHLNASAQITVGQAAGDTQQAVDGQTQSAVDAEERVEQQQPHHYAHADHDFALQQQCVVTRVQFIFQRNLNIVLSFIEARHCDVTARTQCQALLCREICALYISLQIAAKTVHRGSGNRDGLTDMAGKFWGATLQQPDTLLQLTTKLQFVLQQALKRTTHCRAQALAGTQPCSKPADLPGDVDFSGHTDGAQIDQEQRCVIFVQHQARRGRNVVDKVQRLGQLIIPLREQLVRGCARLDAIHQRSSAVTKTLHATLCFQRGALASIHISEVVEGGVELCPVGAQVLRGRGITREQTVSVRSLQH
ncbi:hypothetical protein ALQ50_200084 [Pseudomonas coronafaciens pv. coronafaciens]|nr:hypothetical protein ALQ50_200084 [Pseudomonas coronafaciens pv. coronafaciens]